MGVIFYSDTHILAPSLTLWGGILVRMVSYANGRNGRNGKLNLSSDEIGACSCSNVDLHVCVAPPTVGVWSMAVLLWQLFVIWWVFDGESSPHAR